MNLGNTPFANREDRDPVLLLAVRDSAAWIDRMHGALNRLRGENEELALIIEKMLQDEAATTSDAANRNDPPPPDEIA